MPFNHPLPDDTQSTLVIAKRSIDLYTSPDEMRRIAQKGGNVGPLAVHQQQALDLRELGHNSENLFVAAHDLAGDELIEQGLMTLSTNVAEQLRSNLATLPPHAASLVTVAGHIEATTPAAEDIEILPFWMRGHMQAKLWQSYGDLVINRIIIESAEFTEEQQDRVKNWLRYALRLCCLADNPIMTRQLLKMMGIYQQMVVLDPTTVSRAGDGKVYLGFVTSNTIEQGFPGKMAHHLQEEVIKLLAFLPRSLFSGEQAETMFSHEMSTSSLAMTSNPLLTEETLTTLMTTIESCTTFSALIGYYLPTLNSTVTVAQRSLEIFTSITTIRTLMSGMAMLTIINPYFAITTAFVGLANVFFDSQSALVRKYVQATAKFLIGFREEVHQRFDGIERMIGQHHFRMMEMFASATAKLSDLQTLAEGTRMQVDSLVQRGFGYYKNVTLAPIAAAGQVIKTWSVDTFSQAEYMKLLKSLQHIAGSFCADPTLQNTGLPIDVRYLLNSMATREQCADHIGFLYEQFAERSSTKSTLNGLANYSVYMRAVAGYINLRHCAQTAMRVNTAEEIAALDGMIDVGKQLLNFLQAINDDPDFLMGLVDDVEAELKILLQSFSAVEKKSRQTLLEPLTEHIRCQTEQKVDCKGVREFRCAEGRIYSALFEWSETSKNPKPIVGFESTRTGDDIAQELTTLLDQQVADVKSLTDISPVDALNSKIIAEKLLAHAAGRVREVGDAKKIIHFSGLRPLTDKQRASITIPNVFLHAVLYGIGYIRFEFAVKVIADRESVNPTMIHTLVVDEDVRCYFEFFGETPPMLISHLQQETAETSIALTTELPTREEKQSLARTWLSNGLQQKALQTCKQIKSQLSAVTYVEQVNQAELDTTELTERLAAKRALQAVTLSTLIGQQLDENEAIKTTLQRLNYVSQLLRCYISMLYPNAFANEHLFDLIRPEQCPWIPTKVKGQLQSYVHTTQKNVSTLLSGWINVIDLLRSRLQNLRQQTQPRPTELAQLVDQLTALRNDIADDVHDIYAPQPSVSEQVATLCEGQREQTREIAALRLQLAELSTQNKALVALLQQWAGTPASVSTSSAASEQSQFFRPVSPGKR